MKRFVLPALLVGVGLIALSACDGGDGATTPTATAPAGATAGPTSPPEPTDTPPSPTSAPAFEGTRGPLQKDVLYPEIALLTDVRTGRHDEGFDRVVFEFAGGSTSYIVEYVQPPITEDPSDLPVEIEGNAFLRVVFLSATAVDLSGATVRITCCASEITTGFPSLADLKNAGDFEATMLWVLGLREEVNFRVIELQNPYRIAIDVLHP